MSRIDSISYDDVTSEESKIRRDAYRARRSANPRRRSRKKGDEMPGGIRQRRNKHWSW